MVEGKRSMVEVDCRESGNRLFTRPIVVRAYRWAGRYEGEVCSSLLTCTSNTRERFLALHKDKGDGGALSVEEKEEEEEEEKVS